MPSIRRSPAYAAAIVILLAGPCNAGGTGGTTLRDKVIGAFDRVNSYKLTVLGEVRSTGDFVKPNRYQMTTMIEGKPIKTVTIGQTYWMYSGGKWVKSGTAPNNLGDIASLVQNAKANPKIPFLPQPDQTQDGKRVGTFSYMFKNGAREVCNYDTSTYRVTRCKGPELTLLYSDYNNPANAVAPLH